MATVSRFILCLFPALFLLTCLPSCEKVDPFARKLQIALKRDAEPKHVVGLPPEEKITVVAAPEPEFVPLEPVINKKAQISVLGYHDFTESRRPTAMIIHIDEFRAQMQAIKESEIPVISMQQFLDWKAEKADIPAQCIMITIDDGWKDTHTLAMPVLKEFDFPYTAFLYKKYVNRGGRSMTYAQVQELIDNGGTICSHSVSHDFMNRQRGRSDTNYDEWLDTELQDSHNFLVEHFGDGPVIKTFAYPYGAYNSKVMEQAAKSGYQAAFTVSPGKVDWNSDILELDRYIIHGNNSRTFNAAIAFTGGGKTAAAGRRLLAEQRDKDTGEIRGPRIVVYPPSGSVVKNRLPRVEVDLSNMKQVYTDTISMRISGLGKVPHRYDQSSKIVSYQIPQRLRLDSCGIQVSFKHSGKRDYEKIGWNFDVDKNSEYTDPGASFIRAANEPVNPIEDLVQKPEEVEKTKSQNVETVVQNLPVVPN